MAFLSLRIGTNLGQSFPIDEESIVLGRHPECAIVVDGSAVSRKHARVFKKDNEFFVEDLKSRNKTFLKGDEIPPEAHRN